MLVLVNLCLIKVPGWLRLAAESSLTELNKPLSAVSATVGIIYAPQRGNVFAVRANNVEASWTNLFFGMVIRFSLCLSIGSLLESSTSGAFISPSLSCGLGNIVSQFKIVLSHRTLPSEWSAVLFGFGVICKRDLLFGRH